MGKLIGREDELSILEAAYKSDSPELIALFGRRRVGKTFLVTSCFSGRKNSVFFNIIGVKDGKTRQQLKNFTDEVISIFYRQDTRLEVPKNWFDAFKLLAAEIKASSQKKIVLFFDEFPWMVTHKSELLPAFEYFWNKFCAGDPRVKLIICGSSAGWILKKIVNNRGGLYNRVSERIHLVPFTLLETKRYLAQKGVRLNNKQITHIYMVLGGIPFYLSRVNPGLSAIQAIAELAFKQHSFLLEEFDNLFATLFNGGEGHIELARIIAQHRYGIGQESLAKEVSSVASGGTLVRWLKDLEQAGFIKRFKPFLAKKRGVYYKMVDEYTLFYFKWIEPIRSTLLEEGKRKDYWERLQSSQGWLSWAGYAFESICYRHINQISNALGISASAIPATWRYVPAKGSIESGAQVDLLFDRYDDTITLCEIKYTHDPFVIDKSYAKKLEEKIEIFRRRTKTRKNIDMAFISASGLKKTLYSGKMVSGVCVLNDLFKKA